MLLSQCVCCFVCLLLWLFIWVFLFVDSLTHGFMTPTKRVSATSVYFESLPYHMDVSVWPHDSMAV